MAAVTIIIAITPMTTGTEAGPRRRALLTAAAGLALPAVAWAQQEIRVTDLLGRPVRLPRPAERVLLVQGRHLMVLNLLLPDPVAVVAGWGDDMLVGAVAEAAAYRARLPALDRIPVVRRGAAMLDVEPALATRPDLVLFSRSTFPPYEGGGGGPLLRALEAAGIPSAVVDFFVSPLRDTRPSLALLGRLLGVEARAGALADVVDAGIAAVRASVAGAAAPSVMMHAHAGGVPCCASPGRGVFDDFVRLAGGHSIGADILPGPTGTLSLEYLLSRNPEVYVATGGSFNGRGGVLMGGGIAAEAARASLREVIAREKLAMLGAVRGGQAHALWHACNDSPAHLVAIEALARWIHPGRTAAIDPMRTLDLLNERFAAVPMQGTYWIDLDA